MADSGGQVPLASGGVQRQHSGVEVREVLQAPVQRGVRRPQVLVRPRLLRAARLRGGPRLAVPRQRRAQQFVLLAWGCVSNKGQRIELVTALAELLTLSLN